MHDFEKYKLEDIIITFQTEIFIPPLVRVFLSLFVATVFSGEMRNEF